jgi:hypothetical protein
LRRVLWARVWRALLLVEWGLRTSYNRVRRNARRAVIGEMGQQVEARIVVMLCLWPLVLQLEFCAAEEPPRKWGPKLRAKWEFSPEGAKCTGKKTRGC